MYSTLERILNNTEPVQLNIIDASTDIDTAIYVFNQYMQLTLGQYYKIELLSNHCSCLYGNGGRRYIGLVPNKDVITFSQELVTKCNNFHTTML